MREEKTCLSAIGVSRDKRREGLQRTEKKPMSMWSEIEGKGERKKKERRKDSQWQKLKIISEGSENWLRRMECQSAGEGKGE